jgi:transaldolase
MKYFLDSAKLDEIDYAYKSYAIDGVTTNPKHIMASGKPFMVAITRHRELD